jgi:hypothetical protein
MSSVPDDTMETRPMRRSGRFRLDLRLVVLLGLLMGLVGAGWMYVHEQSYGILAFALVLAGALVLMAAACGTLIVIGRESIASLRFLQENNAAIQQQVSVLAERAVRSSNQPAPPAGLSAAETRALLLEIRETMLLSEPQRERRFERLLEREVQRGLTAAERHVIARDFHRAREELGTLAERFGQDDRLKIAHERLEKAAESARANDLTQATQRVDDLSSMARWDEAERAAREVLDKYPVSQEANTLLIRVQRERKVFEQRHRQRLFDEIQQFVNKRRWQDAAIATHKFLENFAVGPDSDALRSQLETLAANADIQARQTLEQQLKVLIKQHQYWDALALARRIISEHPLSPQANALRAQVARLEELARQSAVPAT